LTTPEHEWVDMRPFNSRQMRLLSLAKMVLFASVKWISTLQILAHKIQQLRVKFWRQNAHGIIIFVFNCTGENSRLWI